MSTVLPYTRANKEAMRKIFLSIMWPKGHNNTRTPDRERYIMDNNTNTIIKKMEMENMFTQMGTPWHYSSLVGFLSLAGTIHTHTTTWMKDIMADTTTDIDEAETGPFPVRYCMAYSWWMKGRGGKATERALQGGWECKGQRVHRAKALFVVSMFFEHFELELSSQ